MNRILYRIMYWLKMTHWDTNETPPEVQQAFSSGQIPAGAALDLGCGTGTNVIFMAKQGRQAIGLDFVPEAISKARKKAAEAGLNSRAQFLIADVTRLNEMDLPATGFALDMGCFHGLSPQGQRSYAEGLAKALVPGGWYLLYTLDPGKEAGISFGMTPESVKEVLEPWFDITHTERGLNGSRGSTWFWMEIKVM
jgi:SAM-dependent methyltransferase